MVSRNLISNRVVMAAASVLSVLALPALAWNPSPNWKDSYAVDGVCYCDSSNYDHNLSSKTALTPIGVLNVVRICEDIEAALGKGRTSGRIPYNDIQCGNGPANDAADEKGCPGRVDIGSAGCDDIGPKWDLESVYGSGSNNTPDGALSRDDWELSASHNERDAYLAIDNVRSTRWATDTNQASGQWFEIDLQSAQTFNSIVLETAASPNDYPRRYQVFVSNNGINWGSAIVAGAGNGSRTTIEFNAVSSRYLRIEQTGSASKYWWSIHEINLYDSGEDPTPTPAPTPTPTPTPPQDETTDVKVTASTNDGNAQSNTLDGDLSTRWSAKGDGQWIKYDLGKIKKIDAIDIAFYKGNLRYAYFDIELSSNNSSWRQVFTGMSDKSSGLQNYDITDADARYVRITGHGNSSNRWNSITEVKIKTTTGSSDPGPSNPDPSNPDPEGQELIVIQKQNTTFAIDGNSGANQGQQIYLWNTDSSNVNQQWIESTPSSGYSAYRKNNTNLCLDGGNGAARRQAVTLENCSDSDKNQHWRKVTLSNGTVRLEKRDTNFSIDGNRGARQRQEVYLWNSSDANINQQWQFLDIGR